MRTPVSSPGYFVHPPSLLPWCCAGAGAGGAELPLLSRNPFGAPPLSPLPQLSSSSLVDQEKEQQHSLLVERVEAIALVLVCLCCCFFKVAVVPGEAKVIERLFVPPGAGQGSLLRPIPPAASHSHKVDNVIAFIRLDSKLSQSGPPQILPALLTSSSFFLRHLQLRPFYEETNLRFHPDILAFQ